MRERLDAGWAIAAALSGAPAGKVVLPAFYMRSCSALRREKLEYRGGGLHNAARLGIKFLTHTQRISDKFYFMCVRLPRPVRQLYTPN